MMKAIKQISNILLIAVILAANVGIVQFRHVCPENAHEIISVMPNSDCCGDITETQSCCKEEENQVSSDACQCIDDFELFSLDENLLIHSKKLKIPTREQLFAEFNFFLKNEREEFSSLPDCKQIPAITPRAQLISYLISLNSPNDPDPLDFC